MALTCNPSGTQAVTSSARIARALASATATRNREACSKAADYTCTRKVFSPDVADGQVKAQECAGSAGLGDICTEVVTYGFNTREANAFAGLSPEELEPGGSLNYETYLCGNSRRAGGSGPTLAVALDQAYSSCLEAP
ncbi:MAG TPA: hypothetical protein VM598_04225 [Bdellovibrionota bacterium]|nr:hypothetical protein [Bdellovibrionota bacterium]